MTTRLAVLGSPIGHSKSPALHLAAYRALGLDWHYEAIEVVEGSLGAYLSTLDDSWRGLSLTMPLKREILPLLDDTTDLARRVGAANTVVLADGRMLGDNTDVAGIVAALANHGIRTADRVHVLGAGATAGSAIAAAAQLGATEVLVSARRPAAVASLAPIATAFGIGLVSRGFGEALPFQAAVLVDTLPGGIEADDVAAVDDAGSLFEVSYEPWPTPRAARWLARGGVVVDGLEMLVEQALRQVRLFVAGDQSVELPNESRVAEAMRLAVERS